MISTAGLELTNFINTDLTWKKVSKGNRSTTRRTRKLVTKNLVVGMEVADNSHRRTEGTTVSESEKIGQRFSGKVEHVPIKKRKFNFRSPSPPPRTPLHKEAVQHPGSCPNSKENRLLLVVDASREAYICPDVVDVKDSDLVNEEHGYREDFSGIEMLAAAACSDRFDSDVDHPEEKAGVEESLQDKNDPGMPMEETVALLKTSKCSPTDIVVEDRVEDSSYQNTNSAFAQNSSSQNYNNTVEISAPSRLHWDLNVVMDSWEQPSDTVSAGSQTKDLEGTPVLESGKLHVLEGYDSEKETKDTTHEDMVNKAVSSEVHEQTHSSSDLRGLSGGSDKEDNQLETSSHLDSNCDEAATDPKAFTQVVSLIPSIDNVTCPNNMASNMSPLNCFEEKAEYCASVQEDETVCAENVHDASTCVPVVDIVTCEIDMSTLNKDGEHCAAASSLHNDINAPKETMSVESCEPHEPVFHRVEPASKTEEEGVNNPSSTCEDIATSSEPMKEVQPVVTEGTKGQIDSSLYVQSDKLMHTFSGIVTDKIDTGVGLSTHDECGANAAMNSLHKTDVEEPCDDIIESDASQDDKAHIVCMENSREFQDGYDSQFEDGELRDSNVHCWEEDINCEGAEIDQVDYESECEGERFCISEAQDTDNKRKIDDGSSPGSGDVTVKPEQCTVGDALGDSITSSETRTLIAADSSKIEKRTTDCEDVSNGKDITSGVVGSKTSLSPDVLPGSRSGNVDDLGSQSEREADANRFMGRDRFALQMHCRSPGGGHIVNTRQSPPCHSGRPRPRSVIDNHVRRKYMSSSSNSAYRPGGNIFNTRHSPPWHGPYDSGRPRPRSVIESQEFVMASERTNLEATGIEGFDSRVRMHINSSASNIYRPLNRSSMAYREDIYTGAAHLRDDISPDRSRQGLYGSGRPRPRSVIESREFVMASDRTHLEATGVEDFDSRVRRHMNSSANSIYRPLNRSSLSYRDDIYAGTAPLRDDISPDRSRHGPCGSGRPRPRNVTESREFVLASDRSNLEATGVEGIDSRVRRPLNRGSLAYRDDIYTGTAPLRDDISPDRSRFRRYTLRDDSRGIREDYYRPMANYSTDDPMQHRLSRRERSISPLGGERLHCVQPYKKPQSRSRSRSPNGWFLLREQNEGSRRRSRSPTFRPARINRGRIPYKKRSEVEYEEEFIFPPRNRISPQCNSRFDDRISGLDNLRDRKSSPVRMLRQGQRGFDPGHYRSIRPMIHPRRFTEVGGTGRGCKYQGGGEDDDRRKQGNRYEIINRVRRYNDNNGGVIRRLRNNNNNNNAEDTSVANEVS